MHDNDAANATPETHTGDLRKMVVTLTHPITYSLPVGDARVPLNELMGRDIKLSFTGDIHCVYCGRKIRKTYQQGYCYPCFIRLARCDMCILKPETCHFHKGTCREEDWGRANCMQPHVVYLANSSGLKVGITRAKNVPTRWIDQGAAAALPIVHVASRYQSGLIEHALRQHVNDRTNWQAMLKGPPPTLDLEAERDRLMAAIAEEAERLRNRFDDPSIQVLTDEQPVSLEYPVLAYPKKISAINLNKQPLVRSTLMGIKGQYLILNDGVINIRKHAGYRIDWTAIDSTWSS